MKRALVVDDSLTVRMALAEILEDEGFHAAVAGGAAEAREALAREPFDVAILDVGLPDGDGIDLLAELRADPRFSELAVVILSGLSDASERLRAFKAGADLYLGKPYDPSLLMGQIWSLVRDESEQGERPLVLVIDDSLTVRNQLQGLLAAEGWEVRVAASGEEGLRLASRRPPSLVVVDAKLPGLDGAAVIRRLKEDARLDQVPCVLLTGTQGSQYEVEALEVGADAFLRKGDQKALLARLRSLLRPAPSGEPAAATPERPLLALVEDAATAEAVRDRLGAAGFDVMATRHLDEACEVLAMERAACVVAQASSPEGTRQMIERLQAADPQRVPVVLLVGVGEGAAGDLELTLAVGADDQVDLQEPVAVIRGRLRANLRRHRRQREAHERHLAEMRGRHLADLEQKNRALAEATERARRESQFKSRFLANMSHELRTPLNAIIGFSEILEQRDFGELNDRQLGYVRHILGAGRHLLELVNDVLDLSKVEAGRMTLALEPVDLGLIARSVAVTLGPMAEKRGVDVILDIPDPPPFLEADPTRITQILTNLLSNGIKFTPAGGQVALEVAAGNPGVRMVVRDTGIGIAEADLPRLFREFEQLKQPKGQQAGGTGLGLALTRRLVELHGGQIAVESRLGEGSTFTVWLPGRRGTPRRDPAVDAAEGEHPNGDQA